MRSPVVIVGIAVLWGAALPARAQDAALGADTAAADTAVEPSTEDGGAPSPLLPIGHWSIRAARRAEALGLAGGFTPAQRSAPRDLVARALMEAARRAPAEQPGVAALAEAWLRRFREEFPEYSADGGRRVLLGGRAGVLGVDERGVLEPARGLFTARRDPVPRRGEEELGGLAMAAVRLGRFTAMAEPRAGDDGVRVPLWDAAVEAGGLSFAFGRQPVGFGPARGGGIVLSGSVPLVRAQIETPRPVRLPSLLRHLGPTAFHTSLTRFEEPRQPGRPWFWMAHLTVEPHPRFEVGVSRASMFGGDSTSTPTTAANIGKMLLGLLSRDFENQEVALDLRWRLPTERVLPATAYMEWGAEDASGAWWTVPGNTFGLLFPRLPGAPAFAAGAEYTRFAAPCCGNPPWYLHAALPGSWVYRGEPLGHPLGGEGWEALAYSDAELWDARLRVSARAFLRDRSDAGLRQESLAGNLYAPLRTGRSTGGELDAALRLARRLDARVTLSREWGGEWSERRLRVDLSYLY